MSYGYYTRKDEQPTEQEIEKLINGSKDIWKLICNYLEAEKGAIKQYKFYGKNYGWALGFSKSGKSVISLYPAENDFWFQVILNERQESAVLKRTKNKLIQDVIGRTAPIHEGKWIFVRYSDVGTEVEVKNIIDIRMDKELA
jgi:hypothetical protein